MTGEPLSLNGCAPTPLASYLKALGVLRLISSPANHVSGEAADPHARGWWENECFHLRTKLSRAALLHFFLHDYAPSPIIAPWNGRAGFLEGDAGETSDRTGARLMRAIDESDCPRLELMRRTVHSLRGNHDLTEYNKLRALGKDLEKESRNLTGDEKKMKENETKKVRKKAQEIKSLLLPILRSDMDSHHVCYIDACYVLSADEAAAPLLGSGGNDGSRDFGVNFAEKLESVIDFENGTPTDCADFKLDSALFDVVGRAGECDAMGQYSPGHFGPNATVGYKGSNPLNPWDLVLAMEGALMFAGALTRRWGTAGGSRGAFPFTFEPTGAGTGSLSSEDPNRPRGEVWTPVWTKPAMFSEVAAIFAEGRLTAGQRTARTGLDAARSVARLGSSRGLGGFERYSIIQPDSKIPYQATPLGRFNVPDRPRKDLVDDLETGNWLDSARRQVDKKTVPARARQVMRRLEDALFQMTSPNHGREGTQYALMALGSLVAWLATNPKVRGTLTPPPLLSSDWIREADDDSPEFRIAAALAGLGLPAPGPPEQVETVQIDDAGGDDESSPALETPSTERSAGAPMPVRVKIAPPMAAHFAPLDEEKFFSKRTLRTRRAWSKDGGAPPTVVWGAGPLVPNMLAVLERRLVEAAIRGLDDKPLASATAARLADVAAFLSGDFDDTRCAALLAGLVWAQPTRLRSTGAHADAPPVPVAYAALKPVFTPDAALHGAGALPGTTRMPVPPGLLARLRTNGDSRDGRASDLAVRTALARARASGLPTPFGASRSGSWKSKVEGGRMGAGVPADRLAAALLIPVGELALTALIKRAYPGALPEPEDNTVTAEDTTNAA